MLSERVDNITVVLGDDTNCHLDEDSVDVLFCKNAFHDFIDPGSVCRDMRNILRPGGKAVIVDYREGRGIPWVIGHYSTEKGIDEAMEKAGFTRVPTPVTLPKQHYLVYT